MPTHIKNRGTGAGGAQTNKNGLNFEKLIGLEDEIQILKRNKDHDVIIFKQDSLREFLYTEKAKFHKCMTDYRKSEVKNGHGCKFPDGAVVDLDHRKIFILEKKFQQCSGSVCEKVQPYHLRFGIIKICIQILISFIFFGSLIGSRKIFLQS